MIDDAALLTKYFDAFGHKPCFMNDVRSFLQQAGFYYIKKQWFHLSYMAIGTTTINEQLLTTLEQRVSNDAPVAPTSNSDANSAKLARTACSDWVYIVVNFLSIINQTKTKQG